ncbi:cytidylyltransferase domain-containing protein [Microbacterium profundi]|uniref:cytidylyltransferase domain-containing protein n=1 Tax=Microbacterium profundi TaxID=450380 RepID=UPI00068FCCEA|nr:glycosyltransferase family protein [Microbacterium profundi]
MTSTRIPGKVLLEAGGKTMLAHHLDRLAVARHPVIVATTTKTDDDPIADIALTHGASVFRGSENDVLGRFAGAAREHALDVVVRVTSDCPLVDGELISEGIDCFIAEADDDLYLSNTLERSYPRGLDFEVFSAKALLDADTNAQGSVEREHVTPYLYRNRSGRAIMRSIRRSADASRFRITLDVPEDREVLMALIESHAAATLGAEELIALLEAHPEIAAINSGIEQKKLGQ